MKKSDSKEEMLLPMMVFEQENEYNV